MPPIHLRTMEEIHPGPVLGARYELRQPTGRGGLEFVHDHRLVPRDVEPASVLVGCEGRGKVAGVGIAKAAFDTGGPATTGSVLGSAADMSREQVEGSPVDGRSDVDACGATL